jgi:hypothetical protein
VWFVDRLLIFNLLIYSSKFNLCLAKVKKGIHRQGVKEEWGFAYTHISGYTRGYLKASFVAE